MNNTIKGITYFQKKWLLLCCVMLVSFTGFAQYAGYKPVADLGAFKKMFASEAGKIMTIQSHFVQEKTLMMLSEKITSEGKFSFKRSNLVRIEYQKPFFYLLVLNNDKMMVKDDQKQSTMNLKSSKLFQQVNKIMLDGVQGTMLDNPDFSSRVFENDTGWLLEMTPVNRDLQEFFSTILIFVDRKDYSVNSIQMNESSGDKTLIRFTQKELNVPIADEVFAVH